MNPLLTHLLIKGEHSLFALDGIEAHVARLHSPVMSDGVDVLPALISCNLNVPRKIRQLENDASRNVFRKIYF